LLPSATPSLPQRARGSRCTLHQPSDRLSFTQDGARSVLMFSPSPHHRASAVRCADIACTACCLELERLTWCAALLLAPPAPSLRDAVLRAAALSSLGAALVLATPSAAMSATVRAVLRSGDAALVLAASARRMEHPSTQLSHHTTPASARAPPSHTAVLCSVPPSRHTRNAHHLKGRIL
jgi:hypothetical protein